MAYFTSILSEPKKSFRPKSCFAIWAFDQFFLAADWNRRDDEKKRQEIHSRFFRELRNDIALRTANRCRRLFASPGEIFRADNKKHKIKLPVSSILIRR